MTGEPATVSNELDTVDCVLEAVMSGIFDPRAGNTDPDAVTGEPTTVSNGLEAVDCVS